MARDVVHFTARRPDTGEMGRCNEMGFFLDANNGVMGALARRSPGSVGHRNEARLQRRQPFNSGPQSGVHLLRLGREEFERYLHVSRNPLDQRRTITETEGIFWHADL